jgi:hypothetical protein
MSTFANGARSAWSVTSLVAIAPLPACDIQVEPESGEQTCAATMLCPDGYACRRKCRSQELACYREEEADYACPCTPACGAMQQCNNGLCTCSSTAFRCANRSCVGLESRCNGKDECGDNSDESNCLPDLVIDDFLIRDPCPLEGACYFCINKHPNGTAMPDAGDFLSVANQGRGPANAFDVTLAIVNAKTGVSFGYQALGEGGQLERSRLRFAGTLGPGEKYRFTEPFCASMKLETVPKGEYQNQALVDQANAVKESNETNNATSGKIPHQL